MQLTSPIIITSRLMPGIQIGKSFISIEYSTRPGDSHRCRYQYYLDLDQDGKSIEYDADDIQSGCQGGSLADGLSSLLSFMSACGESYRYAVRKGIPLDDSENGDLFPPDVAEWCYQNSDELSILACEIEENPNCIMEE